MDDLKKYIDVIRKFKIRNEKEKGKKLDFSASILRSLDSITILQEANHFYPIKCRDYRSVDIINCSDCKLQSLIFNALTREKAFELNQFDDSYQKFIDKILKYKTLL